MAIAFDSASNGTFTYVAGTVSFSHTCSGTKRILLVHVNADNGATLSATYNGVSMTQLTAGNAYGSSGTKNAMFYLLAPATGSNTVTVNSSAGYVSASSGSYTGVTQGSPINIEAAENASAVINNQASPWSFSLTSTLDNCWMVAGASSDGGVPTNAGASTTLRCQESGLRNTAIFDSNGVVSPAGSRTLQISGWAGSRNCWANKVMLAPAVDVTMTAANTSYTYTGYAIGIIYGKILPLAVGAFNITSYALTFTLRAYNRFTNIAKSTTTPSNQAKSSTMTPTNVIKNTSSWTNQPKP